LPMASNQAVKVHTQAFPSSQPFRNSIPDTKA
jgi:hypothetical protein